jgi:hypothetical protein
MPDGPRLRLVHDTPNDEAARDPGEDGFVLADGLALCGGCGHPLAGGFTAAVRVYTCQAAADGCGLTRVAADLVDVAVAGEALALVGQHGGFDVCCDRPELHRAVMQPGP